MSSYTIPEEIIGVPLFVPDQYDYFSIDSGGMPNGDDCLVVHGDVSNAYKAFIFAPTLAQDVLHNDMATGAMTFWLKTPSVSASGFRPADIMISPVTRSNSAPWTLSAGPGTTALCMQEANNGREVVGSAYRDGTWHMCTWQFGLGSGGRMFKDNDAAGSDGDAFVGSGTVADTYLCIGAYSASETGYDAEWRIGKLAFHDHNLNLTERSILYNAMTV